MVEDPPEKVRSAVEELRQLVRRHKAGRAHWRIGADIGLSKYPIDRLSSGSWLTKGLGYETLRLILVDGLKVGEESWRRAEHLWRIGDEWRRSAGSAHPGARDDEPVQLRRYGRGLPGQPDRSYPSIDEIDLILWPDGRLTGTIQRVEPEEQRGARWDCAGIERHDILLITFWPAKASESGTRPSSAGQMLIQRESSAKRPWPGTVVKLERHTPQGPRFIRYDYWLSHPDDPKLVSAASTVAVCDFDNTLARGWILLPWLAELAAAGIGQCVAGAERLNALLEAFASRSDFGHDRLALEAAATYAESLRGVRAEVLRPLAAPFVSDYLGHGRNLFLESRALLAGFRTRGLRTVLVTGAPAELTEAVMRELDFERSFPLQLAIENGVYTGQVLTNHGLSTEKASVCDYLVTSENSQIVVAVGDSEGDLGMWRKSAVAVCVGAGPAVALPKLSKVDLDTPLSETFWADIPASSWLNLVRAA